MIIDIQTDIFLKEFNRIFTTLQSILTFDDHFTQFIHSSDHFKARRSFLQLIWLLCVWLVWNEHNNILYNNIQANIDQLVEKVKFHSLWWLKANKFTLVFDTHGWLSDPLLCLGID